MALLHLISCSPHSGSSGCAEMEPSSWKKRRIMSPSAFQKGSRATQNSPAVRLNLCHRWAGGEG